MTVFYKGIRFLWSLSLNGFLTGYHKARHLHYSSNRQAYASYVRFSRHRPKYKYIVETILFWTGRIFRPKRRSSLLYVWFVTLRENISQSYCFYTNSKAKLSKTLPVNNLSLLFSMGSVSIVLRTSVLSTKLYVLLLYICGRQDNSYATHQLIPPYLTELYIKRHLNGFSLWRFVFSLGSLWVPR
jgi:hypothetical protein